MLYRLSFQQLLLLAFLLLAGLVAAAALQGVVTLEQLVSRNHDAAGRAAALSADTQRLTETTVGMERTARQYLVLGDQSLQARFEATAQTGSRLLDHLAGEVGDPTLPSRWNQQLEVIRQQFVSRQHGGGRRQEAVGNAFRELAQLNAAVTDAIRQTIRRQNAAMLAELDAGRRRLEQRVLASLAIAVAAALVFGLWLGRPMKRLGAAIDGLGERLDEPLDIKGPRDLRQLGLKLEWLRQRLLELDNDKARFLRHVSHELKTPLTSIREGVALLHEGVVGELNTEQREVVDILREHSMRLQKQIEDLLRLHTAAFEARTLQCEPLDVGDCIRGRVEAQRLQWQARRLAVSVTGGALLVPVDREKFTVVIDNLLANAIRFSPAGGTIRFLLAAAGDHASIDVVDCGPGIADADRARLFEPFYRGRQQPDDNHPGNGIGLSIVREYVNAHGGQIELLPNDPGAHFRIELPYAQAAQAT